MKVLSYPNSTSKSNFSLLAYFIIVSLAYCRAYEVTEEDKSALAPYGNLYDDLLVGYDQLIRPVKKDSDKLFVKISLKLTQLIGVDEVNQVVTVNVWLKQEWIDYRLQWDPAYYDNISQLVIPSEGLWRPDVVLFNNADGNYEVTQMTRAHVFCNGTIVWEPPAIYKSYCRIDVEFFPYDMQRCEMRFGSWTYDGRKVDLRHWKQPENVNSTVEFAIDLSEYTTTPAWDIIGVEAQRTEFVYPCCPDTPHIDITYTVVLRRRTLFYTVTLIFPCVAICFLTLLVFYLPSDSGEKITLCISILVSLTLFFLLLAEIIPPTSLTTPLIGKYLMFTMALVTLSIITTVIVLNIHFSSPYVYESVPPRIRLIFIDTLPRWLHMQRPEPTVSASAFRRMPTNSIAQPNSMLDPLFNSDQQNLTYSQTRVPTFAGKRHSLHSPDGQQPHYSVGVQSGQQDDIWLRRPSGQVPILNLPDSSGTSNAGGRHPPRGSFSASSIGENNNNWPVGVQRALNSIQFIAEHYRNDEEFDNVKRDWKFVAMVIDRLLLWIMSVACVIGTLVIVLYAPPLYDQTPEIPYNCDTLAMMSSGARPDPFVCLKHPNQETIIHWPK